MGRNRWSSLWERIKAVEVPPVVALAIQLGSQIVGVYIAVR